MQQRALIAKALASEPTLLALDEPTTGVDAASQESLGLLLEKLRAELGVTILYVSHEFGAVEHVVDRIVLVRGGIVYDGPPSGLPGVWHDPSHHHDHCHTMLDLEFMRLALATGAVVGLLAPAVGFFLVERKASLIGDGLGHVAFAGVALGYLLGISPGADGARRRRASARSRSNGCAPAAVRPATRRSRSSSTRASPPASSSSRARARSTSTCSSSCSARS